jgi:hypothetical protein
MLGFTNSARRSERPHGPQMQKICFGRPHPARGIWSICGHEHNEVTPFADKLQCKMCGMVGKIRVVEDLDSRYVRENHTAKSAQ